MPRKSLSSSSVIHRATSVASLKAAISLHRKRSSLELAEERANIEVAARRSKCIIIAEFSFTGGADEELFDSHVFAAILQRLAINHVGAIFVPSRTTFADDPIVHAVAERVFQKYGVDVVCLEPEAPITIVSAPVTHVARLFGLADGLHSQLRQMEDARRLKFGPPRKKCYAELFPEAVVLAKRLHKDYTDRGVRRSLRELSAILAGRGLLNNAGKPYHPDEMRRMLKGPDPLAVRQ